MDTDSRGVSMTFDVVLWILVGLALGVALSMVLLALYAGLERRAIARRRRAAGPDVPPREEPSTALRRRAKAALSVPLDEDNGHGPISEAPAAPSELNVDALTRALQARAQLPSRLEPPEVVALEPEVAKPDPVIILPPPKQEVAPEPPPPEPLVIEAEPVIRMSVPTPVEPPVLADEWVPAGAAVEAETVAPVLPEPLPDPELAPAPPLPEPPRQPRKPAVVTPPPSIKPPPMPVPERPKPAAPVVAADQIPEPVNAAARPAGPEPTPIEPAPPPVVEAPPADVIGGVRFAPVPKRPGKP
jgi:hypothetical protein